jgi:type III pantothenate kinase
MIARADGARPAARGPRAAEAAAGTSAEALLVEASAARLRVAALRGRTLGAVESLDVGLDDGPAALPAGPLPARVLVANGRGPAAAERLAAALRRAWRAEPEFAVPRTELARLYCAEPHAVGVDRWLAMVGASRRADRSAFAVVTCGAVFAVDLVDGGGRHRGSYVVPGVRPMREALYARTGSLASLAALAPPATDGLFGVNTAGGIEQGARVALASLAERALRELGLLARGDALAFVCGEDAGELRAGLPAEFLDVPDLVLEGLAVVAAERPA